MTRTQGRVTVTDVAAEAGVAIGSVSRALNDRPHVSAELRARVAAAAERLGWEPHGQARGLRLGRSNVVGLLVNHVGHPMQGPIISAVERELSASGRMLLIANAVADADRERALLQAFQREAVDGVIVTAAFRGRAAADDLYRATRVPLVLLDHDLADFDRVCLERRDAVRTATRHLLALGHRRIALFTPALDRVPGGERLAGHRDAHRQAGVPHDTALVPAFASPLQDGAEAMAALLDGPAPPTALIALATPLLTGALAALRRRGRRVPGDCSVIAIGVSDMLELADPPLSCLQLDLDGLGRHAVRLLLRRLATPGITPERVELQTPLVVRDSCAAAPR